ncbi:MAG TPA: hypothetical protein VKD22_16220 [Ramlibacter sp.]|nr:hypothetical protein [Ramlibacter sp.]
MQAPTTEKAAEHSRKRRQPRSSCVATAGDVEQVKDDIVGALDDRIAARDRAMADTMAMAARLDTVERELAKISESLYSRVCAWPENFMAFVVAVVVAVLVVSCFLHAETWNYHDLIVQADSVITALLADVLRLFTGALKGA